MFAEELVRMLETMPLEKVRVVDLCRRCGATPPTFYYHFKDKYDLAAWIYFRDISGAFGDREPGYSPERLEESFRLMEARRSFYQEVFADDSQNSLTDYAMRYMTQMVRDVVLAATGKVPTDMQMLEARHHSYGIIGLQREWIEGETGISTAALATFLCDHTPGFLRSALEGYRFESAAILGNAGKRI